MNEEKIQAPLTSNVTPTSPAPKKGGLLRDLGEIFRFVVLVLVILIPLRLYVAQPFIVVGDSMQPTFQTGQYLIVDEISYKLEKPERGQVIIFKYPKDTTKYFIKRIIGLPGETVDIVNGVVTIKKSPTDAGFVLKEPYVTFPKSDTESLTLTNDQYFVMGDNRAVSLDSRAWGPVPSNLIVGRAFLRLLPLNTASVLPGNDSQTN